MSSPKKKIDGLIPKGTAGTVVRLGGMIGVAWDYANNALHTCGDRCPDHTGWFVIPSEIAHLDVDSLIDHTQFLGLLKGGSYA